jgi:hypothetical protein
MKVSFIMAIAFGVAATCFTPSNLDAQIIAQNYGSLGAAGNGTHTADVVLDVPGAVAAGNDTGAMYASGARTGVPFNPAINPPASSSFTVELWVLPTDSDGDDTPLNNRQASGDRSGWTFFQRPAAEGWNFRMYNGVGSGLGWDLTGGTANLFEWSHIVATWNGSSAVLYVNGVLADDTNDPAATGAYNPNTAALAPELFLGANFNGGSPSTASIDEFAFYGSALTPAQILNHYTLASSPVAGAYHNQVISDGAIEFLPVPEPASAWLLASAAAVMVARRRRS